MLKHKKINVRLKITTGYLPPIIAIKFVNQFYREKKLSGTLLPYPII